MGQPTSGAAKLARFVLANKVSVWGVCEEAGTIKFVQRLSLCPPT